MKTLNSVNCPCCSQPMQTTEKSCSECDIQLKAHFLENEFSRLDSENLHFLRIFIHCEGRIRDMEKSLGVSYPTVKAKLAELKNVLSLDSKSLNAQTSNAKAWADSSGIAQADSNGSAVFSPHQVKSKVQIQSQSSKTMEVLKGLEKGEMDFEEALACLKK